jgi:hypothetical protein
MRVVLSPYVHECYQPRGAGFDPAEDCPACRWSRELRATRQKGMTLREARKLTERAKLAFTKVTEALPKTHFNPQI